MTELEKDLEAIDAEAAECLLDIYPGRYVQYVAARLDELGYVKVVRCAECKRPEHREPGMVWCPLRLGSWMVETDYCSEGERVVAKNATGEEVGE